MDKEPVAPWKLLVAVTVFQALTIVQLIISMGTALTTSVILSFVLLCAIMWVYVAVFKSLGRKGFEIELIAFLCRQSTLQSLLLRHLQRR